MHNKHFEVWSSYYLKIIFVTEIRSLTFYRQYSQVNTQLESFYYGILLHILKKPHPSHMNYLNRIYNWWDFEKHRC